jgi:putative MATE family efflux protein
MTGPAQIVEKKNRLADDNVGKLLIQLSVPATIGMLIMALYNVVDTIFIGKGVGTNGIAGVAIIFPIQMIVGAIGQMLGMGGASLLSRSLGEGNREKAQKTLGNVIGAVIAVGSFITLIGYLQQDQLLILFGATETILPYAREYLSIVLAGIVFHSLAMALNNLVRAEGFAKVAMYTMIIAAVSNIILDAILIFGFKMGIRGAAIATLTAYILGAVFLIVFYLSGKSLLTLSFRIIRFNKSILYEILSIGISSFFRQTAMSILVIIINRKLGAYGGNVSIAVYGVVMRIVMLLFTPIIGISQGLQPVIGYNYGAGNMNKMKTSLKLAMLYSTVLTIISTIVLSLFPQPFIRMFSNDPALIQGGKDALRYILLAFPTVGFQVMGTVLFQATGKAFQTLFLTLSRQILFLIPLILILPEYFHLTGIWISFPVADILAASLTLFMLNRYQHQFRQQEV